MREWRGTGSRVLEVTVRRAHERDLPALVEIYRQGIEALHPRRPSPQSWAAEFEQDTLGECVFVAELAGAGVVGMLSVWEGESFIHHLYIDARYRRRGLGSRLLADVTKRLPGPFHLKCLVSNAEALAFYRRLGWRDAGMEPGPDGAAVVPELAG